MQALILEQQDGKTIAAVKAVDDSLLPQGNVTVDIQWSSLNYKDALAITGKGKIIRNFPMVPGIDFASALVERLARNGLRLFLLGAKPGVAEQAGENLEKRYPDLLLCGTHDGYFQADGPVVDQIRAARADVVFVCLGAPKQERWMAQYGPETGAHLMVGLGGVLDV